MAVVERVASIVYSQALGSRTFQATAATRDTAAGSSVVVTVTQSSTGTAPATPDTFTLSYVDDGGNTIRSVTLNNTAASQTDTFFFTSTGASGGAARAGTVEIRLRVTKTTGGPTATYDTETDGAPNTPPSTYTTSQLDQGWIRSTTTATQSLSNVAAGGAKNSPASYTTPTGSDGGDSLFVRTTFAAASYVSRALTATVSGPTGGPLSAASAAGTGPTWDVTFTRVVDNRFPAAVTTATTGVTIPNATLTGQPFTVLTSTTTDSMSVDPRITRRPLFQLDDNTFGTPPSSKHNSTQRRQTSQQGFLASRTTNARGEGVNGLTYNVSLTPRKPGTAVSQTGLVTTTQGGETGWAPSFLPWSSSLPGGIWDKAATYTAPSDITGASYVLQAAGTSLEYFLTARNDDLAVLVNVQHEPGMGGRHFVAGMPLIATAYLVDRRTRARLLASAITSWTLGVVRVASTANPDGTGASFEYLDASGTWVTWAGTARHAFTMTTSANDPYLVERRFTTTGWGVRDIRFIAVAEYDGVLYSNDLVVVNVDSHNQHDTPLLRLLP